MLRFKRKDEKVFILNKDYLNKMVSYEEKEIFEEIYSLSDKGIITFIDFYKYFSNQNKKIVDWFIRVKEAERDKCLSKSLLIKENNKEYETDKIYQDALKLAGLKKFLENFSSIEDKKSIEVKLWDYYLMYAQIFGIADKVSKDFKKIYPNVISESSNNDSVVMANLFEQWFFN